MKRSEKCNLFLERNEVNSCTTIENESEPYFSYSGCRACSPGLGNNVYDCHGYSEKHNQVFELGAVCHECLCYFANGDDSGVQS